MSDGNEAFDPIEAFLSGTGSGLGRALVGAAAIFAGYGMNSWANTAPTRSFIALDSLFMIFTWGDYGAFFVFGMLALVGGFFVYYRFLVDEGGKLAWFLILTIFTVYYSPMTFPRVDWPAMKDKSFITALLDDAGEPVQKNDWIRLLTLFAIVTMIYWLLPAILSHVMRAFDSLKK